MWPATTEIDSNIPYLLVLWGANGNKLNRYCKKPKEAEEDL